VAVASAERLPLWAGLAGLATFAGTYETTFNLSPSTVTADLPPTFAAAAVAAAVGLLVGGILSEVPDSTFDRPGRAEGAHVGRPAPTQPWDSAAREPRTEPQTDDAPTSRGGGIEVVSPSKSEANPS
jgi:hypothetical protein